MSVPASARAIVSHDTFQAGGWKMEEVGLRQPGEGELLVEMVATGVCHTDALIGGIPAGAAPIAFYPRVLGHEGAGYVRAVGPGVTVANKDDPVLLSFAFCGKCPVCKSGGHSHCPSFNDMNFGPGKVFQSSAAAKGSEPDIDGTFFGQSSFANWSIVKQCSVVNVNGIIKDKKDLQMFAPLGCGIQTGSGTVVNAAKAGPNDIICIIGLGGVGLSAIMGAKIQGCKTIIGIDRIESRMALAKEMGATHAIDTSKLGDKSLGDAVKEIADGVGPNITIDTTGVAFLMDAGWEFTRFKGRYFQVGSPPFDYTLKTTGFEMLLSGKQYQGVVEGAAYPPDYVPKMIQWYREGKFPIDKLLKLMPAADFNQAMHEMHSGETIKPILTW